VSEAASRIPSESTFLERRRVILGLGRPQERRLLAVCREDPRVRVVARCSSAPEVLAALHEGAGDVALVDEDLHLLDDEHLDYLEATGVPAVVLARDLEAERWHGRSVRAVSGEAEATEILLILAEPWQGDHRVKARPAAVEPSPVSPASDPPGHLQVFAFWSGSGSPGRTTLAINWGALLGSVARTIIVDLDLSGAAVAAQLDQTRPEHGRRESVSSNLLQLASANPDSSDKWRHEVFRVARPLGRFSPHADVLAGVPRARLRDGISAEFVERLITELRHHYTYILLDLGDEPLGEPSREAAVGAAALRAADQIIVVCPPDAPGLYQTSTALAQAGPLVDRGRAGLIVNRYDQRYHQADVARIEEALKLPLVGLLPLDAGAVQRALAEGRPVVCDRASKLRRPLQDLAERVHGAQVKAPSDVNKQARVPALGRLRAALAGLGWPLLPPDRRLFWEEVPDVCPSATRGADARSGRG